MKKGLFFLLLLFAVGWGDLTLARVYKTKDMALRDAFPEVETIEKMIVFLDGDDQRKVEAVARMKLDSRVFTFYIGKRGQAILGYALFGSHVVRTKPEVYMVIINPDGSLRYVEILAFYEPEEYLPPKRWFEQFTGKTLDDTLWPRRGIRVVAGATLSVNGITHEVRKALAVFQVMVLKMGGR